MTTHTLIVALTPVAISLALGTLNFLARPDTAAKWEEMIDRDPKRAAIHKLLDGLGIGPHDLLRFATLILQKKVAA
jgi:hypothetical protein